MFFKYFGLPKAGKTKKYPRRRDYRLRLERLEEKALLAVVLPSLPAGSQYQLVIATSLTTTATSADIAYYNTLAAIAGANVSAVPAATWRAWCSTPTVNAVDNVMLDASIPIYNTNGQLVASGKAGFLSPIHKAAILSETGDPLPVMHLNDESALVWTGSNYAGLGAGALGKINNSNTYAQLGATALYATPGAWSSTLNWSKDWTFGIYAISSVLTTESSTSTPAAPTSLIGAPGNGQASLSWTAPSDNGGSPITDYKIEYSSTGGAPWTPFSDGTSTATTATVTELANDTSYVFRVAAVNAAGTGLFTDASSPLTPTNTSASSDFTYSTSAGQVTITGYVGAGSFASIPATIDGLPVTSIGNGAFRNCVRLTGVSVPFGVTTLGNGAFSGCINLVTVAIPNSVTDLGFDTFNGCTSLSSIAIPSSVVSINRLTFGGCASLTSVTISSGTTSIGLLAFWGCKSLASITIPSSVTLIERQAFGRCTALSRVSLGTGLVSIGERAFEKCTSLLTLTIPNSVSSLGSYVFFGCTSLESVSFGSGLLNIPDAAFSGCAALASVALPLSLTSIGDFAFDGCVSLASITIPSGVTAIGAGAFQRCTTLRSITLPDSLTALGNPDYYWAQPTDGSGGVFNGCTQLTTVHLPATLSYLGWSSFANCTSLTSIVVPEGLTRLEFITFSGCSKLSSISLPSTLLFIDSYAFYGCTVLESVSVPAKVASLGSGVFEKCDKLKSLRFSGDAPDPTGGGNFLGAPDAIAYYVRGTAGWATTFDGIPTATTPTAIATASATVGDATVSLSWAAPSDDGGSPITGYMVRYSADDKVTWSTPMPAGASPTTLTIPGLVNGHKYWFEIASQNAAGVGYYSDPVSATPNGPVEFLFTVNSGEATITDYKGSSPVQDVPSSIGGYPVTGLVARAFTTGLGLSNNTVTAIRIPATVTLITGGWWYSALASIDVDASNTNYASYGGILYSKDMRTLIKCPVQLEGQVDVPSGVVTIGDKAFSGCKLTPLITIPNTVAEIGSGAFSVSGLVSIALPESVHSIGAGAFSECRSLTQINIPAGIKTIPSLTFHACVSLSVVRIADGVVSIDRSAFDSCLSLVSLTLPASVAALGSRAFADCPSLARVMFLGNAPAAVDGVFRNDAAAVVFYQRGTSGWTSTYFGIATATTPGDLSPPSAIGSASSVVLSWTAPTDTGGRPITDYRVQYRVDGGTSWIEVDDGVSAATTASVNNLLNGTSYVFRLAAENIAGVGAWSSQSTSATPRIDSPSAPGSLAVISGNGQVSLSWTAPADNGGSSTTAYTIRYSSTGSAPWTYFYSGSTATTATVAGLTNGTSYVFQVAAVNDAGTGAFSDPTPRATPLPAVPGRPTAAAGNGVVILRWVAPRLVRMPRITDYAIRYSSNNGSTWTDYGHTASAATSRRLILTNGNTYIFQVAPVVSGGVGRYSISSLPATPYSPTAKPAAPSGVVGVKTGALISLSWNPVTRNAGGPVKDYVVQYRVYPNGVWKPYDDGVSLTTSANIPLKRLQAGSSYVFRVAAKNLAGVGAYSAPSAPVTALLASISQPPSSPLQISSVYLRPVQRADR